MGSPLAASRGEIIPFAERSPTMRVFEVPSEMPFRLECPILLLADDGRLLLMDRTFFSLAIAWTGPITATDIANTNMLTAVVILLFIVFMIRAPSRIAFEY